METISEMTVTEVDRVRVTVILDGWLMSVRIQGCPSGHGGAG